MPHRYCALSILTATVVACSDSPVPPATGPDRPPSPVLLRDIVIPNLPSPFYHFDYDSAGRITGASYASELFVYDVRYENDRISEMRNTTLANSTTLAYAYDDRGRVGSVKYVDSNGQVFTVLFFEYEGQKLTGVERDRRVNGGFIIDKTVTLSYYADGNLQELREHRPAIDGQSETTVVDRFEQYDENINVDGFTLMHDEFFDHVVLLPRVQLQKGNPARQIHTGDGINFTVDYSYTYDDRNRPLAKSGDLTILNGPDAGKRFQTSSTFTYY
jgi:hypothetical protein